MDDAEAYEYYADPAHRMASGLGRKRSAPRLTTMTSVRFPPEVIEAVKDIAFEEGVTVGSWIRRLVQREIAEPETVEIAAEDGMVRVPADAMRQIVSALMPPLIRHGSIGLQIGPLNVGQNGVPVTARPSGLVEGSGRRGEPRALPSSLPLRSFACPHLSVGNVASAICQTCGPLRAAA